MSRSRKIRRKQLRRNRRIAALLGILFAALFISMAFSRFRVFAEKPTTYKYYTEVRVQRRDTLWSIAQTYMTEEYSSINEYIREVQRINDIGYALEYGQRLMVPYYSQERK